MAESAEKRRAMRKSPFLEWCEADGLKVISGFGVEDLNTAELSHWERLGAPAAYCHLEGSQGFVGALVADPFRKKFTADPSHVRGTGADPAGQRSHSILERRNKASHYAGMAGRKLILPAAQRETPTLQWLIGAG
jgi:hypothetical protein